MNNFKYSLMVLMIAVLAASSTGCSGASGTVSQNDGQNLNLGMPVPGADSNVPEMIVEGELIGVTWEWVRFDDPAGLNNIEVTDPGLYTLVLNADGSYDAKVDCNQVIGDYSIEGSSIRFEPGITSLAECGTESLYFDFLAYLGSAAGFLVDEEQLVLNLEAEGGSMVFNLAE